jgi:hypothetical protein
VLREGLKGAHLVPELELVDFVGVAVARASAGVDFLRVGYVAGMARAGGARGTGESAATVPNPGRSPGHHGGLVAYASSPGWR